MSDNFPLTFLLQVKDEMSQGIKSATQSLKGVGDQAQSTGSKVKQSGIGIGASLSLITMGLKLYPSNSALLHNRGYIFRLKKKFREAITDYETSLKLRPLHIDTLYDKAFAHANLQEWDKADDCYDQILKIDYNHAGAIGDKGVIEASKGDYKESIAYLDKALQIEPGNERVLKNRELALEKLKKQLIQQ